VEGKSTWSSLSPGKLDEFRSTKDRDRRRTLFGWVGSAGAKQAKQLSQLSTYSREGHETDSRSRTAERLRQKVRGEVKERMKITQGWRCFMHREWYSYHVAGKAFCLALDMNHMM